MFYGWYIVSGAFIAQMFMTGFMTYAFSSIVIPLQEEFGVGREQVMLSLTATALVGLVLSPIVGAAVDRFSARWLVSLGAVILAGGLFGMSHAQSITQFVIIFGTSVSLSSMLLGPLVVTTTVSRWFAAKRGRALGIAAIGTSMGGILVPCLFGLWLDDGWRHCLQYLAYCILAILLPFSLMFMRGKPEEMGMIPDGEPSVENDESPQDHLDVKDILTSGPFWYIGLCIALLFAVYAGMMANLAPFSEGLGQTKQDAVQLIMIVAACGFIGKIIFGFAAEKIKLRTGLWTAVALVMIAMGVFRTEPSYALQMFGAACMGFAAGGMLPVWGAMLAKIFGVVSYGKVMGLMNPLLVIFNMISPVMAGYLADSTGSYIGILTIYMGVLVVSAALLIPLKDV